MHHLVERITPLHLVLRQQPEGDAHGQTLLGQGRLDIHPLHRLHDPHKGPGLPGHSAQGLLERLRHLLLTCIVLIPKLQRQRLGLPQGHNQPFRGHPVLPAGQHRVADKVGIGPLQGRSQPSHRGWQPEPVHGRKDRLEHRVTVGGEVDGP